MIPHGKLIAIELRALIKAGVITLGGNKKLKIYGHLYCASGKRMLRQNRVFFSNVYEARHLGYRPCGHCMKEEYKLWKQHNEPI
jgi:methylphosphotriester-DNA--protein-cysteine methyltransferase